MSAMVAYPTSGLSSNPALFLSNVDASSLNGQLGGCHSQGDDNGERSRSSSPISLGAFSNYIPKNGGQLIRNRIFVCGFGNNTAEDELRAFFEQYGNVKDVKVIADKSGSSKGYGFITFESEEEAKRIIKEEQNNNKLNFKDRTLNIGPAIKREVARSGGLTQLNHMLNNASVPELTAGPALYYQSPATLAQVLLPTSYPLTVDSSTASSLNYAAFAAHQHSLQYAVLGNQLVNYATPLYAPSPSQFIDSKYVAGAINGTLNNGDCYSTATHMAQPSSNCSTATAYTTAYSAPLSFPQASLSSLYAASGVLSSNDLMYFGRNFQTTGPYQASNATSASSLSSSVDSSYPVGPDGQQLPINSAGAMNDMSAIQNATGLAAHLGVPYLNSMLGGGKVNGNEGEVDLSQSMSSMSLSNDMNACSENNDANVYQQHQYVPQMYNSIELAAAAAAAAWTYQQNLQQYMAKSFNNVSNNTNGNNNNSNNGYVKASPQQTNNTSSQQVQQPMLAAAAYACKANGSPVVRQAAPYK